MPTYGITTYNSLGSRLEMGGIDAPNLREVERGLRRANVGLKMVGTGGTEPSFVKALRRIKNPLAPNWMPATKWYELIDDTGARCGMITVTNANGKRFPPSR